jgi:hypothetical protein
MCSICFETEGPSSWRRLYLQLWYSRFYMHQYKRTAYRQISYCQWLVSGPSDMLCEPRFFLVHSIPDGFFFHLSYIFNWFLQIAVFIPPLFTFHNSISDRYKCINSHQNSLFEFICDTLKEKNCEPYENQRWTRGVAKTRKRKLTRFKLLQICFLRKNFWNFLNFFNTLQE